MKKNVYTDKKDKGHNILAYLYLAVVLWMSFPIARIYLSRMPFFGYIVAMVAIFFVANKYINTKAFYIAGIYGFAVLLRFYIGSEAFPSLFSCLYEVFILLIPAIMFYYFDKIERNLPFVYMTIILYMVLIVYETVMTYRIEQEFPGILRNLQATRYDEIRDSLIAHGLSTYSLPHALPTIMPALILIIKDNSNILITRIAATVFLVSSLVLVWISQAMGAYLMTIFASILSLLVSTTSVKKNIRKITAVSFVILPFVFLPSLSTALLDGAKSFLSKDNDVYEKVVEMERSNEVGGRGGDITYRGQLLKDTFESIIDNPLFGSSTRTYGNHNALIDRWAKLGLVGFIPLLIFLYLTIKTTYQAIPDKGKIYYIIGVLTAFIMLVSKNQMSWDQWFLLFYLLPITVTLNYIPFGFKKRSFFE